MRIKQTSESLSLRYAPVGMWILGVFLAVVGVIILYGSLAGFVNLPATSTWLKPAFFIMSFPVMWMGFRMFVWHPLLTTTISRRLQNVTVVRNSFYKKHEDSFNFNQIRSFGAKETIDNDGQPDWRLELRLQNNTTVILSTIYEPSHQKIDKVAATANDFLRKTMPK